MESDNGRRLSCRLTIRKQTGTIFSLLYRTSSYHATGSTVLFSLIFRKASMMIETCAGGRRTGPGVGGERRSVADGNISHAKRKTQPQTSIKYDRTVADTQDRYFEMASLGLCVPLQGPNDRQSSPPQTLVNPRVTATSMPYSDAQKTKDGICIAGCSFHTELNTYRILTRPHPIITPPSCSGVHAMMFAARCGLGWRQEVGSRPHGRRSLVFCRGERCPTFIQLLQRCC